MMPRLFLGLLRAARRPLSTSHVTSPAASPTGTVPSLQPTDAQRHRLRLFQSEQVRQRAFVRERVQKMYVLYRGLPDSMTLQMNRGLSTPVDCAAHVQDLLVRRSAVALVDGRSWDMNRPILPADESSDQCELELCHFKDTNPDALRLANTVFWRTCSFLLGAVVESAFKERYSVHLCSFPPPDLQSGSFVNDVRLLGPDGRTPLAWGPTSGELRVLSMLGQRLALEALPFEPLEVDSALAAQMFADSPLKAAQIPAMAGDGRRVTVYRVGPFVDVCRGPLLSHSGQVGRFAVTAAHRIETASYGPLLRFQGTALPPDFLAHFTTFELLQRHAARPNTAPLPSLEAPATAISPPPDAGK